MNYGINNMSNIYNPYANINPYQNALYLPQNNTNQNQQGLIRVNGLGGAKAYQMQPNGIVALFDNNDDYFYLKISDGAGFSNVRKFAFTEILDNNTTQSSTNDFVTRSEFEQLKEEMRKYGEQFISTNKSKSSNATSKSTTITDD